MASCVGALVVSYGDQLDLWKGITCVRFQQSDGGGTIKLGSKGLQQWQLRVVKDEGVQNYWLKLQVFLEGRIISTSG